MTNLLDEDNTGSHNFQNVDRWIKNDLLKKKSYVLIWEISTGQQEQYSLKKKELNILILKRTTGVTN